LAANVLPSGARSIGLVRVASAALVGLLAAGLFATLGRRKGFWVFLAATLVLVVAFTVVTIPFVVW